MLASACCILALQNGAAACSAGRTRNVFPDFAFRHTAKPALVLMRGRSAEALAVLEAIGVANPLEEKAEIVGALHEEERKGANDTLVARKYRRSVVIAFTVGLFSQLRGINSILYYLNDIFSLAGASRLSGNLQTIVIGVTVLVATLVAISIIDRVGRRPLLLAGTAGLIICLSSIGYLFYTGRGLYLLVWLLMAFIVCFAASHGVVVWVSARFFRPTSEQMASPWEFVPLDRQRSDFVYLSAFVKAIWRGPVLLFCGHKSATLILEAEEDMFLRG